MNYREVKVKANDDVWDSAKEVLSRNVNTSTIRYIYDHLTNVPTGALNTSFRSIIWTCVWKYSRKL